MRGRARNLKKALERNGWKVVRDRREETDHRLVLEHRDGRTVEARAPTRPRAYRRALEQAETETA